MSHYAKNQVTPDTRPFVSVLVPAYNEAAILQENLTRLARYMSTLGDRYRWELLIVDDGSIDRTGELARAYQEGSDNTRLIQHPINLGLGRALCSGFNECRGQYVVVIDIDLTYTPDHIGTLLDKIVETRAEIVIASPYMKGGLASDVPLFRRLLSRWGNRFLALTTRGVNRAGHLSTLTGMVRVYDGGFIRALNLKSPGTEINTEIIYKAMILGARIEEIPAHVDWGQLKESRATRTSARRLRRGVLFGLFSGYMIRPFSFFIIPATVLGLVSLYPLFWVFYHVITYYQEVAPSQQKIDYALSEAIARAFELSPHAFFVGGVTLVLSVQLFSLGILALQVKHSFEELFHFSTRLYARTTELEVLLGDRGAMPGPGKSDP